MHFKTDSQLENKFWCKWDFVRFILLIRWKSDGHPMLQHPGCGGIVFTEYTNRKQPVGLGLRSFIIRKHLRPLKCQSQSKITARRFSYFPLKHFDDAIGSIVSEQELVQLHFELTNTKGKTYVYQSNTNMGSLIGSISCSYVLDLSHKQPTYKWQICNTTLLFFSIYILYFVYTWDSWNKWYPL